MTATGEHSTQRPSQALERALTYLEQVRSGGHGRCNHQNGTWFLEMDTWGQLEMLRQLLCQRDPGLQFPEQVLEDIDTVLTQKHGHTLLTPSASITPSITLSHGEQTTRISVWKGDITTLTDVTAIVNAANSALLGCFRPSHRCIDNVIHSAAGPRLRQACYDLMLEQGHEEPVGRAKVTPGFNIPAPYVIHTVGPQLDGGQTPGPSHRKQLGECYVSCLEAAESLPALADGRKIVVFCCISTGLFAFPSEIAADIAIETVYDWCLKNPGTTVTDVIFDTFLQRDWELYNARISQITPGIGRDIQPPRPAISPALQQAQSWLHGADYLIISAGAGLSAATGLDYTSPDLFAKHFPAFLPLGLRHLYDVFGFSQWASPAQKWGYYLHHLNMVRTWPASPLYKTLLGIASRFGSRCFIRTSNADGLFLANGFHPARISTPQGQYAYLQCFAKCRREAVFPSVPFVDAAMPFLHPETQILTDESKIPYCKYCGGELTLCVRGGDYFNQTPFASQEREYARFLQRVSADVEKRVTADGKAKAKAVVLELGVGMNTPSVLRWANEELVEEAPNGGIRLIRAGLDAAGCAPWELEEQGLAIGIAGDLNSVFDMLATK